MSRDITLCHPRLQKLAGQLTKLCAGQGLPIGIGECFRSAAEQDALYAQGRTKPGAVVTNAKGSSYSSMHQWGIAFDFYRADKKGAYNEEGGFFQRVGAIGKSIGLEWGGDWRSIVDKPHFQLPDWGSTPARLKTEYKTFENFKKTWEKAGQNSQTPEAVPAGGKAGKAPVAVAYSCGNGVRVRAGAGTNTAVLRSVNHGNLFDVLGYSGGWVHVNVAGTVGYIYQDYVAYRVGTCTGNGVRVRAGAGTNTAVLRSLNKGNLFDILGYSGDWVRVNVVGTRGYVYKNYVG